MVGRDLRADMRITHPLISRAHLLLRFDQGRWLAIDNGSLNGTYVNGRRVPVIDIHDGQTINIGNPDGPQLTLRDRPPRRRRRPAAADRRRCRSPLAAPRHGRAPQQQPPRPPAAEAAGPPPGPRAGPRPYPGRAHRRRPAAYPGPAPAGLPAGPAAPAPPPSGSPRPLARLPRERCAEDRDGRRRRSARHPKSATWPPR